MIQAEHITKRFDDFTALKDVSCTIPQGCIYGMVGSNGAGKSTFLRLMAGVYQADSGMLTIDGQPVWENPESKAKIAYVPDDLFFLSGANLHRMAKLYESLFPRFDRKRYTALTELFSLDPKKSIGTFSKGMKRQAATLLALSLRPDYIFFDETFDGLDPVMRSVVKRLICEDVASHNATAIITSHSLRELEDTCDQLALLHKGGLVFERDIQDLKTSLFKVQIAFSDEYDESRFAGGMLGETQILRYSKKGSVANLIVRGDREETVARLQALCPLLLDVLPLTLEEVFTYEMELLGYDFKDLIEEAAK